MKYEKTFLLKFGICILLFLSALFYTKYLDYAKVVPHMFQVWEMLKLKGNELNYFSTCYTVGCTVFQVPVMLLITKLQFSDIWYFSAIWHRGQWFLPMHMRTALAGFMLYNFRWVVMHARSQPLYIQLIDRKGVPSESQFLKSLCCRW